MEVAFELPPITAEEAERAFLPSFQLPYQTAPFLGEVYDWASRNVELPHGYRPPGLFDVGISPYLVEPFQAVKNPAIRQVSVMAPPRSGKTLLAEVTLLYLIANSPGHILWVQATEKAKNKMGDARMAKLLRLCPPVSKLIDPKDRFALTQNRYRFANGVEVHLASATLKSLQSFGYKYVVFDECWLADPSLIAEAQARVGDYPNTYKIILISQGGDLTINPDWELEFNKGIVKEYGFTCPKCRLPQLYLFNYRQKNKEWAGLVWPRNATTYADGEWVIEEAAKAAVLKCINPGCQHCIEDTPANRDYLHKNSAYLVTKANGDASKVGFRYNALGTGRVSFATLTKEWLEADRIYTATGDLLPKHQFRQKRLAETPGRERQAELLDLNVLALEEGKEWKPSTVRFLTVDVQRKAPRFWYVCREWCKDGDSRKIAHGSCHSWEELDSIRERLKVKKFRVFVDAGDGQCDDEIFTRCTMIGDWGRYQGKPFWYCYVATKGFGLRVFKENGNKPYKIDQVKVNLPPLPKYKGVYGCAFVKWSNPRIKTVLQHLRDGKGAKWLSNDVDAEYQRQLVSEIAIHGKGGVEFIKVNETDPNEYWDCEALQVLAATYYGVVTVTPKGEIAGTEEETTA